jgi:acyl-CoA thioesterase
MPPPPNDPDSPHAGARPAGDLLLDTTLAPDATHPGRYRGEISEAWKVMYAFGGVSMTASLRAMQEHLARPELSLVTANAIFCAPVPCGPVTADVMVLRNGRGAAQVACDLHAGDSPAVALRTHGVFGIAYESATSETERAFVDVEFPTDVKPPEECPPPPPRDPDDLFPDINFHHQTDWRPAIPRFWERGRDAWEPGPARFAAWTRLLVEPWLPDGTYDPLSLGVPADSIGPAIGARLGPHAGNWMTLSLEIGLRFIQVPRTSPAWILQDMTAWQCGDGYATGPSHLWDTDGNLLAIAQQTAHLREFPVQR